MKFIKRQTNKLRKFFNRKKTKKYELNPKNVNLELPKGNNFNTTNTLNRVRLNQKSNFLNKNVIIPHQKITVPNSAFNNNNTENRYLSLKKNISSENKRKKRFTKKRQKRFAKKSCVTDYVVAIKDHEKQQDNKLFDYQFKEKDVFKIINKRIKVEGILGLHYKGFRVCISDNKKDLLKDSDIVILPKYKFECIQKYDNN